MSKEVLAVVAGEEITQEQFDLFVQGLPREQQTYLQNPQFKAQCLEQLVALYLFAKKGEELLKQMDLFINEFNKLNTFSSHIFNNSLKS